MDFDRHFWPQAGITAEPWFNKRPDSTAFFVSKCDQSALNQRLTYRCPHWFPVMLLLPFPEIISIRLHIARTIRIIVMKDNTGYTKYTKPNSSRSLITMKVYHTYLFFFFILKAHLHMPLRPPALSRNP